METFDCSFMEKILLSKVSDRIDNVTNLKKIKFYEKLLTRVCSMFKLFHNNTVRILSQDSLSLTEMIEERREIQQRISARSHQNTIKKLLIWNIINFEDDNATAFTDDEDENGSFSAIVSSPPALPLRHSANDNSEEMMIMVNGSRGKEKEVDGSCDVLTTGEISINIINNNGVAGNGSSSIDMDTSLLSPFPSSSKKKRKRGSKKNGSGGSGGESSASRSFSKKKRKRGRKKNGSGRSGGESSASSTTSTASSTSTSTTDEDETRTTKVNDVTSCLKQDDYASSTNFQDKARLQIEEVVNFETSVNVAAATTNYVSKNVLMVNNEMDAFSTPESVSAPLIQPDLLTTANGTENCDGLNVFTALPPQLFKDTATTANTGVNVLSIIETPTTKLLSSPVHTKKDILLNDLDIPISVEIPNEDVVPMTTADLLASFDGVNDINLTIKELTKSVEGNKFNIRWYVKHSLGQIDISPNDEYVLLEKCKLGVLTFNKENTYIIPDGTTKKYYLSQKVRKKLQDLKSEPFNIIVAARCCQRVCQDIVVILHNLKQNVYDEFITLMGNTYKMSPMIQIKELTVPKLQKFIKKSGMIIRSNSYNSLLGFNPRYHKVFGVWGTAKKKSKLYFKICCRDISNKLINCGLVEITKDMRNDLIDSIKYMETANNQLVGTITVEFRDFINKEVYKGRMVETKNDKKKTVFLINNNVNEMCFIHDILFDYTDGITYLDLPRVDFNKVDLPLLS